MTASDAAPASLADAVVVITGASRGIGAATARAFAEAGARTVLAARPSADLAAVAAETGGLALPTDVRDESAVRALSGEVERRFGRVDVLVCSAGLGRFGPVSALAAADFDLTLAVNLRGTFLVCQAFLPLMLRQGRGHIFTLASIAATRAFPGAAAYCAAKWGVLGFSRVLAEEVRRQGVKVTALLPGSVDSPFWDAAGGTELPREAMLHPRDVADAILAIVRQPARLYTDEITLMPPAGVL